MNQVFRVAGEQPDVHFVQLLIPDSEIVSLSLSMMTRLPDLGASERPVIGFVAFCVALTGALFLALYQGCLITTGLDRGCILLGMLVLIVFPVVAFRLTVS